MKTKYPPVPPYHKAFENSPDYRAYLDMSTDSQRALVLHSLADLTKTRVQAVSQVSTIIPAVQRMFFTRVGGDVHFTGLGLSLALRFLATSGRTFEIDPKLDEMLTHTDIGDKAPADVFRLPYQSVCLHFPIKSIPVDVFPDSEVHYLTNAYITEIDVEDLELDARKRLGIEGPCRGYEVAYVCRQDNLEWRFLHTRFIVPDSWSDIPLVEVLDRQLRVFVDTDTTRLAYGEDIEKFQDTMAQLTNHVVKCLMIINGQDVVMLEDFEADELEDKLKRVKPGKQRKVKQQLQRAYNKIYVRYKDDDSGGHTGKTGSRDFTIRGHWRRGHFRMQPYGPGRTKHRVRWIKPIFVKGDEAKRPVNKTYRVKN